MRLSIPACALLLILASPALSQVDVETMTGTFSLNVAFPGTPNGPGLDFNITQVQTSLDFTPGSVTFEGMPIDFDGTEASFLATTHSGTASFPVMSGPATVPATGEGTSAGPALNGTHTDFFDGVQLGPGFGPLDLDLIPDSLIPSTSTIPDWNSPVVPELNGRTIILSAETRILGGDLLFGIVDASYTGTLTVTDPVSVEQTTWSKLKALFLRR